jgi:DNA-binding MarR family transcriptional regulator
VVTAKRLLKLFQQDEQKIQTLGRLSSTTLQVFRKFCLLPLVNLKEVCERTGLSFPAAVKAVQVLEKSGIVHEITGRRRNRVFAYSEYLNILNEGTEVE